MVQNLQQDMPIIYEVVGTCKYHSEDSFLLEGVGGTRPQQVEMLEVLPEEGNIVRVPRGVCSA